MRRAEREIQFTDVYGNPRTMTLIDEVSPDDIVQFITKAYIYSARRGLSYSSPLTRELKENMLQVYVANKGV